MDRVRLQLLTGSHVANDLYQGAVPALVALLAVERGYSYLQVTGITLAATVFSSVAQPGFGALADRRDMRWLVPAGIAAAGIGIGLAGLGDHYLLTWLVVALSGIGVAAFHPEAARLAREASAGTARGMSWFALGGNVGFALGPALATPVLLATGLTGTPLLAIPAVATALVLAVVLRRPAQSPAGGAAHRRDGEAGPDQWRAFGWLTGVVVLRSVVFFGLVSLLSLYLIRTFNTSAAAGNAGLTALLVAGMAGTLLGGHLADRWGRVNALRLGHLLAIPGIGGLLLAPSFPVALPFVVIIGVAVYIPFSIHLTLGQEYLPNHIGTASGVTLGLAVSAGGVFAPVLGYLADAAGVSAALLVLLVVPVIAVLGCTRLPEPRSAARPVR